MKIIGSKSDPELFTVDISRGGVFVQTDTPKPVRHLLRLRIDFAQGVEPIEVHGMVVHTTSSESAYKKGEAPGMGIEFIAFGGEPRERWEGFLRQMSGTTSGTFTTNEPTMRNALPSHQSGTFTKTGKHETAQGGGSSPPVSQSGAPAQQQWPQAQSYAPTPEQQWPQAQSSAPAPVQQQWPQAQSSAPAPVQQQWPQAQSAAPAPVQQQRPQNQPQKSPRKKLVRTVFPIPVAAVEQLYDIYEQELVAGEMFVCTPQVLKIGDRVAIRIIHPVNGNDYDLHGKVQMVHSNPQYPGLNIALRASTLARREKFRAFVEEGLPEEEVPLDYIEE